MEQVKKLENMVAGWFKGAPPLQKSTKESLATAWPWVALVFGVLQLAAAWGLWRLFDRAQPFEELANQYSQYFGGADIGYSSFDKTMIYLAIAIAVVQGVLLLMAFSPLRDRLKKGWDLMFLSAVIGVAYSVSTLFVDGRGVGSFIFGMIITGFVLYLMFQLRDMYSTKATPVKK